MSDKIKGKGRVLTLEQWGQPDQNGNYSHNITIEGFDPGQVKSVIYRGNPQRGLKFEIGKECEYEAEKKVWGKDNKEYWKISPPSRDDKYSKYKDPVFVKKEAIGLSQYCVIETFKNSGKDPDIDSIDKLTEKYFQYIYPENIDYDVMRKRYHALYSAVSCILFKSMEVNGKTIFKTADRFLMRVNEVL